MKKNIYPILACTRPFISGRKSDEFTGRISASAFSATNLNFAKEALDYVQLPHNKYFIYKDSAGQKKSALSKEALQPVIRPKPGPW